MEYEVIQTSQSRGSQSVVPGQAAAAAPINLAEMHIPGSQPDLLNQRL